LPADTVLPVVVATAVPPATVVPLVALLRAVRLLVVVGTVRLRAARRRVAMVRRLVRLRVDSVRPRVVSVPNLAGPPAVR
jgi:hypothetical protein